MRRGLFVLAGVLLVVGSLAVVVTTSGAKVAGRGVTTQGVHTITVTPWGPDQQAVDAAKQRVDSNARVQSYLKDTTHRLLSFDYIDNDTKATGRSEPPTRFRATYFDYSNNRSIVVEGGFYDSAVSVSVANDQPNPSPEEFDAAVAVVAADPEFGPALSSKRLEPYPPMPPLSTDPSVKGKPERTVTVGLFPTDDKYAHEIVGVNMVRRTIVRYGNGAPPSSNAAALNCGVPSAGQGTTSFGTAGQVEIVISRDGVEFWRFICIRPSASSGTDKSGIELRDVRYQGKMVLSRANAPILNVQYERNFCGPFRDWLWQEGMFDAPGTDVPGTNGGIRMCTGPPGSVLDTGTDFGNYRGVAIWDREEVRLLSEMNAGWYRYISEWRFHDDGSIEPLFGYGAVTNTCVCRIHTHHVYWRLDFDIVTAANNNIFVNSGGVKKQVDTEIMHLRDGSNQSWVIQNSVTNEAAVIQPRADDGNADKYGRGDVWLLRSNFPGEIDDSAQPPDGPSTSARLNPMINGQSISNQDVVVWYAGHWRHDHFEGPVPGGPNYGGGPFVHGPKIYLQKY
ncbi:MAG TPA: hypothetical protein VKA70_00370 [Blastocatellia bacterium]|nr:hypothetical protein [Blastocatellia bacterium]